MKHSFIFAITLFFILTGGCVPHSAKDPEMAVATEPSHNNPLTDSSSLLPTNEQKPQSSTAESVILNSGDEIEVKFRFWPELDELQEIRPDGKISLQLIGAVSAAGLTPEQLETELIALYETKLKSPEINIIIRSYANQRVYVGGEVLNPGLVELKGKVSALEAIMAAGGFEERSAKKESVVIIRHLDNTRYITTLNLAKSLKGEGEEPYYLTSQDIIYVPQTRISKLNQWVDQYLSKIIPVTGFGLTRVLSPTSTVSIGSH